MGCGRKLMAGKVLMLAGKFGTHSPKALGKIMHLKEKELSNAPSKMKQYNDSMNYINEKGRGTTCTKVKLYGKGINMLTL